MAILLLTAPVAKAEATPQYGGVVKIVDLSEGAQPIGAPWQVMGIDSNLMKPAV
jgi:hypothetical protein